MNDEAIQNAISSLDKAVPKEGARVAMVQYGGGPDESQIIANRQGYLRLGIEFLKAAYSTPLQPEPKAPDMVKLDLEYLLTNDSDINFDWCERCEPGAIHAATISTRATTLGTSSVVAWLMVGLILCTVAMVIVMKWIAG
jgi:hypothetical protein